MNTKESLIFSLHDIGAIQFGEFLLKSGETSSIYLNLRTLISYPELMKSVAQLMWQLASDWNFKCICGVPYTALPFATCISITNNVPMIMRRKEKKDYGTKKMVEGHYQVGDECLLIEDVITTGGSVIETAQELQHAGLKTPYAIVLIDREQGGYENLTQRQQIQVKSILTISEVLDTLLASSKTSSIEKKAIHEFLDARVA